MMFGMSLIQDYNKNAEGKQLLVTGHSLGAALATLYSARINDPDSAMLYFRFTKNWNKGVSKEDVI